MTEINKFLIIKQKEFYDPDYIDIQYYEEKNLEKYNINDDTLYYKFVFDEPKADIKGGAIAGGQNNFIQCNICNKINQIDANVCTNCYNQIGTSDNTIKCYNHIYNTNTTIKPLLGDEIKKKYYKNLIITTRDEKVVYYDYFYLIRANMDLNTDSLEQYFYYLYLEKHLEYDKYKNHLSKYSADIKKQFLEYIYKLNRYKSLYELNTAYHRFIEKNNIINNNVDNNKIKNLKFYANYMSVYDKEENSYKLELTKEELSNITNEVNDIIKPSIIPYNFYDNNIKLLHSNNSIQQLINYVEEQNIENLCGVESITNNFIETVIKDMSIHIENITLNHLNFLANQDQEKNIDLKEELSNKGYSFSYDNLIQFMKNKAPKDKVDALNEFIKWFTDTTNSRTASIPTSSDGVSKTKSDWKLNHPILKVAMNHVSNNIDSIKDNTDIMEKYVYEFAHGIGKHKKESWLETVKQNNPITKALISYFNNNDWNNSKKTLKNGIEVLYDKVLRTHLKKEAQPRNESEGKPRWYVHVPDLQKTAPGKRPDLKSRVDVQKSNRPSLAISNRSRPAELEGGKPPNENNFKTKIIVLLNLIIINKLTINRIIKKLSEDENFKDTGDINNNLLKILTFLRLIDLICKNNYSEVVDDRFVINNKYTNIYDYMKEMIKLINDNDNDYSKNELYELSHIFSWSLKTQHISKSQDDMAVFIYEIIMFVISQREDKNKIIVIKNEKDIKEIKINKKYMKDRLNDKIKVYNKDMLETEEIRDDIIMEYFRTYFNESNGLNEIRETKKKIETYGIDSDGVYIKMLLNKDNDKEETISKLSQFSRLFKKKGNLSIEEIWNNSSPAPASASASTASQPQPQQQQPQPQQQQPQQQQPQPPQQPPPQLPQQQPQPQSQPTGAAPAAPAVAPAASSSSITLDTAVTDATTAALNAVSTTTGGHNVDIHNNALGLSIEGYRNVKSSVDNFMFFHMIKEDPDANTGFSENDFLSNWSKSPINFKINEKEETFENAEQLFMAFKAKHHDNIDIMNRIIALEGTNYKIAKDAKDLGREITINVPEWDKVAPIYMKIALLQKFTQNIELRNELINTGTKYLIEASPHDKIWGAKASRDTIILNITNKRKTKIYDGDNKLGVLLMHVRDLIQDPDKLREEFLTGDKNENKLSTFPERN